MSAKRKSMTATIEAVPASPAIVEIPRIAPDAAPTKRRADGPLSVVVIQSADDLAEWRAAWEDLARATIESNVFYEPWMLLPALRLFGQGSRIEIVLVTAPDPLRPHGSPILCGLFPLERKRHYRSFPVTTLRLWKYIHCYLCTPLVRAGYERECIEALFGWLDKGDSKAGLMEFNHVPGEGKFYHLLVDHLHESGKINFVSDRFLRTMFRRKGSAEIYLREALSGDTRRILKRKQRRLAELGHLRYVALDSGAEIDPWIERFLALEASGWKGRQGSAMGCSEASRRFFREAVTEAFRHGRLRALALLLDDRPIAHQWYFVTGDGSFAFKTAFDEEFAKSSPGVLLQIEQVYRLHEDPEIEWMDSCAVSGSYLGQLWTEGRLMQTVLIGTGKGAGEFVVSFMPLLKWIGRKLRLTASYKFLCLLAGLKEF
ncbi:MAG TPA: GNAT family N-acetyltransferase [Blastocatellia bacterium]|nr:GNAT family N-acetyltransferase [Blastocatellia bacterium]